MRRPWVSVVLIARHLLAVPLTANPEPVQAPAQAGRLGTCWCPEKQRGEVGGLHSNRALGDTEMDLHGNNKAAKEK